MIIFLSYSSINTPLAHNLAVELGMLGHDVQFEEKFAGGDVGWHDVFESIKACDLFVFALTQWSSQSYSCHLEYNYAHTLGKRILPVQLETIDSYQLPSALTNIPHLDLTTEQEATPLLAQALERLPPPNELIQSAPLYPEFATPLRTLLKQAETASTDENFQRYLFYNLREFLERTDTFNNARDILRTLQTRSSGQIRHEIGTTFQQIDEMRIQRTTSRRRSRVLRDIALVVGGAIFVLLLIRGVIFVRSSFGGDDTIVTPTLENEESANSLALLSTEMVTPEETETVIARGTITATADASVLAAAFVVPFATQTSLPTTFTSALTTTPMPTVTPPTVTTTPDQMLTQAQLNLESTVTRVFATAFAMASFTLTPIPPTFTSTLTATPTPTRTNTPIPTATFTPDQAQTQAQMSLQSTVTSAFATAFAVASSTQTPIPPTATFIPTNTPMIPTVTSSAVPTNTPTRTATRIPPSTLALGNFVYTGILVEDTPQGVRVRAVSSAARNAGIQVNDIILVVGFDVITSEADVQRAFATRSAYSIVNIRLRRATSETIVRMTLNPVDFVVATAVPTG